MNREIKFRIAYKSPYTSPKNKWLISEPLTPYEMMFSEDTQVDFTDGGYLRFNEMVDDKAKIIFQQWTGLKDKNGNEIYEGDIIKYSINNRNISVNFNNGCFMCGENELYFIVENNCEVIGNIYQNKELLK